MCALSVIQSQIQALLAKKNVVADKNDLVFQVSVKLDCFLW